MITAICDFVLQWGGVKERVRGNHAGCEKEGKKDGSGREDRDMMDVNNIFIKEFYCKWGFYEWNFIVTCQAVPVNSNWRLGSWFEILETSCIDGVVWKFRISVVKTLGTGFDICEVGIIDILGAGGIRPGFWWKFVDTDYAGAQMVPRDFSGPYQPKLSRIISPMGQSN